ncbi:MAG: multiheme c-type cytochrome [Candidatus Promineifilaceae bacterium]
MNRFNSAAIAVLITITLIGIMWLLLDESTVSPAFARPEAGAGLQGPLVPSTANDFILPGTQPGSLIHSVTDPSQCTNCHANYDPAPGQPPETRTWQAWQGSMMAQAGRDPLFFAALDVANAGAAEAGEFCLRCHLPRGWLEGRSSTPDGSEMTGEDREGVQCEVCHRLVDREYTPGNPNRDEQILDDLDLPVASVGSGQMIIDPEDFRRGPFDIVTDLGFDPHALAQNAHTLVSPYHQDSELCGTCHDINNPIFSWDEGSQSYQPNPLDEPGDISEGFPIERTFSEWKLSDFNTPVGVKLPKFGGNKESVSTCQDCHMKNITGTGGAFFGGSGIVRRDMPLHDLTGGNTWVPEIIPLHPEYGDLFAEGSPRREALDNGILRAREMLQNAARLKVSRDENQLSVTVYNDSGHKLPTGYVEGRRMWLQVEGYDADCNLVYTSGAYDDATGILEGYHSDPTLKVYEAKQGLSPDWAEQLGLSAGPSFHFALNNEIVSDNRIPPRGYSFVEYNSLQAAPYSDSKPDPDLYADGQYWDMTGYALPADVAWGNVRLIYQTASKEYIEFLRDNSPDDGQNNGEILYDLWEQSGKSKPEVMVGARFGDETCELFLPSVTRP